MPSRSSSSNLAGKSLRKTLALGLALMLLPLVVALAVIYFSQNLMISYLDTMVEETTEEIGPVLILQQRLVEASMPPHGHRSLQAGQ